MPMVQILAFGLLVSDIVGGGDLNLCLRNLPSLKNVVIKFYGERDGNDFSKFERAEAIFERAAADHPNRPNAIIM
jgi:hypothetical protein